MQDGLKLRLWPLVATLALAIVVPYGAAYLAVLVSRVLQTSFHPGPTLEWLYVQHGFQLLLALVTIAVLKRFVRVDYGLHPPRGKTYYGQAILWGAFFGVLMTLVDYAPQLLSHAVPKLAYPLTPANAAGWLFFEGVYVGPTEEIPFRALLVTFLAATMPGKLRLGRFAMNWAGIIVAVMFALLHASSFDTRDWPLALGQQVYAFALGVFYAYWLEKSKSIAAPILGHNVSDFVEYALLFAWVGFS
jgi:hypothetical protein